ncbi:MAG: hypothetical protein K1X53_02125 [Candidatus Sumerlaeaceae bacterium]|nr:hypothetical protein [Candidatus Sumerlaeaceae bacterium]
MNSQSKSVFRSLATAALLSAMSGGYCATSDSTTVSAWVTYEAELKAAAEKAQTAKPSGPQANTQAALSACFGGQRDQLAQIYRKALAREQATGDTPEIRESESILYLFNSTLRDRDEFLLAQEIAARETQSDEMRTRIILALLEDEYYEIHQLNRDTRYNRMTKVFNRASASLSKLAMFQPQDAAQLLLDSVYSIRQAKKATDRERRMVFLARKFLAEYPNAPEATEVAELQKQLQAKLDADRAAREQAAAQFQLDRGNYDAAEYHAEIAALMAPEDQAKAELLAKVRQARGDADEREADSLSVSPADGQMSSADKAVMAAAVNALLTNDKAAMERVLAQPSGIRDSVVFAASAFDDRNGNHDGALATLRQLAKSAPGTPGGIAAAATISNPDYNLDEQFDSAVEDLRQKRNKFILSGKRTGDENAYMAGSAAIQSTGQAASGVPFLFLTDMLVRGVTEQFKTQMDTDRVVDSGARYVRRYPNSARSAEISAQLAKLTRQAGEYTQSKGYLAKAGTNTPENEAKLRNDQARKFYDTAMSTGDLAYRKKVLQYIGSNFPDAKIALTAQKALAKLPPTLDDGSVVLTRKMLEKDTALARQMGINPAVLDGQKSGGEMAEEGLALDPETGKFSFRLKDGLQPVESTLPAKGREQIVARAEALRDSSEFRMAGDATVRRQVLPLSISGGAGGSGVEVSPKLIPVQEQTNKNKLFQ